MITIEEFNQMKEGTVFYVAGGGDANNIVKETFVEVTNHTGCERTVTFVTTKNGASRFEKFLRWGECCYLNEKDAVLYMESRHAVKMHMLERQYEEKIKELQSKLDEWKENGYGQADYIYLDRS